MNILESFANSPDTICALSTPAGSGAIAVIRISGEKTIELCNKFFHPINKKAAEQGLDSHHSYLGKFIDGDDWIDEVMLTLFHAPNSYTGQDVAEISCHGSLYIQQRILESLLQAGARIAKPGEFTLRAFLNGKFDLSQAEAVADLIDSNSKAAHDLALTQMRGGFSSKIKDLRRRLLDLASLFELELDFSEEDVEFADRSQLKTVLQELDEELTQLLQSFAFGNVIKQGIPVAIIGKPNVGKSTLLNALLNEERAIVSDIPGTTRDTIEDTLTIKGLKFRFIDTAGLRSHSEDVIENIGIGRTYEKIREASVILYVFDISSITTEEIDELKETFHEHINDPEKQFILIGNKTDLMLEAPNHISALFDLETIFISAKRKENVNLIIESLLRVVRSEDLKDRAIVSNARHYEALNKTVKALENVRNGLDSGLPTDLVAIDMRSALHYLGEITGEVSTEELLGNIFGKFCIGK
ncbi:MAG: tRNA uridine-5-carboxymethylaminomethyl(34) synthesis GTPase MnmE [Bacteroidales bacterium]|nr:tRNA uridine-5-carboxymethylaminomethyl(34) synthesis GTPase MnmE [Bacteroidales bacterium]